MDDFRDAIEFAKRCFATQKVRISFPTSVAEDRIEHARTCRNCYDNLNIYLGRHLQNGWEIEPIYWDWIAGVLLGSEQRPLGQRGRPQDVSKDWEIQEAVRLLVEEGLNPTRNDEKNGPHDSACDAVAAALCELDRSPRSYRTVKEIWLKRRV